MALTQISTAGVKDDAISAGKIPANAVGSSEIADDAVGAAQIADDGVAQAAVADEAIDEARLQISNAGSNGQFLQKQSGNTGGLTWAAANQYTPPNHSGEVTSSADGATTIASNIVDEDNLKISNAGTNGQYLQKQSGNTGGLTWADVTIPPAGNTFTAVANGAIANNKTVKIETNGKVSEIKETSVAGDPPTTQVYSSFAHGTPLMATIAYDPDNDRFMQAWRSNDNNMAVHCRVGKVNANGTITYESEGIVAVNSVTSGHIDIIFVSHGRFAICWCEYVSNAWTGKRRMATISESGGNFTISLGTVSNIGGNGGFTRNPKMVKISNTRIATLFRVDTSAYGTQGKPRVNVSSIRPSSGGTPTGTSDTYIQAEIGTHLETSDNMSDDATGFSDGWFDSTNDILYFIYKDSNDDLKLAACTNSNFNTNFSNDLTLTIESLTTMHTSAGGPTVAHVSGDNYVLYFKNQSSSNYLSAMHFSVNPSTYAVTKQTEVNNTSFAAGHDHKAHKTSHGNILVSGISGGNQKVVSSTVSGTTVSWGSGITTYSNAGYGYEYLDQILTNGGFLVTTKIYQQGNKAVAIHTLNVSNITSNMTYTREFVGYADGAYSDGQTATIKTFGNNVDTLSGLTAGTYYYLQGDGTIGTDAAFANANREDTEDRGFAGLALSSSKLLIHRPTG